MSTIGSIPAAVYSVIQAPERVSSVMCQPIACCTSMEPNMEANWPPMNKPALRFQSAEYSAGTSRCALGSPSFVIPSTFQGMLAPGASA